MHESISPHVEKDVEGLVFDFGGRLSLDDCHWPVGQVIIDTLLKAQMNGLTVPSHFVDLVCQFHLAALSVLSIQFCLICLQFLLGAIFARALPFKPYCLQGRVVGVDDETGDSLLLIKSWFKGW